MQKSSAPPAISRARSASQRRLHSFHALLREKEFHGRIEEGRQSWDCQFKPSRASITDGKLEMSGSLVVKAAGRRPRTASNVRAALSAIQGGLGGGPAAPARYASRILVPPPNPDLPLTEATGAYGYAGVLYFHLSPLDGRRLGVPLDLSRVQMNARLWPTSPLERDLQWLLSALAGALLGETKDENLAREYLGEINQILNQTT